MWTPPSCWRRWRHCEATGHPRRPSRRRRSPSPPSAEGEGEEGDIEEHGKKGEGGRGKGNNTQHTHTYYTHTYTLTTTPSLDNRVSRLRSLLSSRSRSLSISRSHSKRLSKEVSKLNNSVARLVKSSKRKDDRIKVLVKENNIARGITKDETERNIIEEEFRVKVNTLNERIKQEEERVREGGNENTVLRKEIIRMEAEIETTVKGWEVTKKELKDTETLCEDRERVRKELEECRGLLESADNKMKDEMVEMERKVQIGGEENVEIRKRMEEVKKQAKDAEEERKREVGIMEVTLRKIKGEHEEKDRELLKTRVELEETVRLLEESRNSLSDALSRSSNLAASSEAAFEEERNSWEIERVGMVERIRKDEERKEEELEGVRKDIMETMKEEIDVIRRSIREGGD